MRKIKLIIIMKAFIDVPMETENTHMKLEIN